jgi:hypothetical protein
MASELHATEASVAGTHAPETQCVPAPHMASELHVTEPSGRSTQAPLTHTLPPAQLASPVHDDAQAPAAQTYAPQLSAAGATQPPVPSQLDAPTTASP